jgi:hypothetical protein
MSSFGGMILTGENRSSRRKEKPVSVFSTSLIWTGLGLKPALCDDRPATNRLTHGMALISKMSEFLRNTF